MHVEPSNSQFNLFLHYKTFFLFSFCLKITREAILSFRGRKMKSLSVLHRIFLNAHIVSASIICPEIGECSLFQLDDSSFSS